MPISGWGSIIGCCWWALPAQSTRERAQPAGVKQDSPFDYLRLAVLSPQMVLGTSTCGEERGGNRGKHSSASTELTSALRQIHMLFYTV